MKLSVRTKTAAGIAGLAMLAFPLAACGSDSSSDTTPAASSGPVEPLAQLNDLSINKGQTTAVKLDAGFAAALKQLGLTPSPLGTAKIEDGSAVFPITGGWAAYFKPGTVNPYVVGQIQHEGSGLNLTAGNTTVTIGNFNVDPGISIVYGDVAVNGKSAATDVPIFTLDGTTLNPLQTDGNDAILQGTKVYISGQAAGLLNSTFNTDAVTDKLLVGVATITLDTSK